MMPQSAGSAFPVCSPRLSASSNNSGDRSLSSLSESSRRCVARARRMFSLAAALLFVGVAGSSAHAQTLQPAWNQLSTANNPGGRFESSLTYDAAHGQVVLFSGDDESNDTWLWNGTNWTQAFPAASPSARYNPAMVYDPVHGNVVLFGGSDSLGNRLGDTWLWNGTTWTQASPATSPTARNGSVMVYDAATSQVLLFGGTTGTFQNDTWVWNGSNWAQLSPVTSPIARADFSMVYDAAQGEVVLFGGEVGANTYSNDTWLWNGTNWTQVTPANSPSARYAQGMAYNAALGQAVMFGGSNGGYLNDTWVWNGTNWTQETPLSSPSARIAPNAMTYDAAQGEVILFSGLSGDSDTWEWGLPQNFGSVNVCPGTSPSGCPSNTLTLTFNVPVSGTYGTPLVVTQGTSGLDFQLQQGGTDSCIGGFNAGDPCQVSVTFTPQ